MVQSERAACVHTIALTGALDASTAATLELELMRVEATDAPQIVVDLSALTSIDSEGLKTIIHADSRSRRSGRLTLVAGSEPVQRTFETTGLGTRLAFRRCASGARPDLP